MPGSCRSALGLCTFLRQPWTLCLIFIFFCPRHLVPGLLLGTARSWGLFCSGVSEAFFPYAPSAAPPIGATTSLVCLLGLFSRVYLGFYLGCLSPILTTWRTTVPPSRSGSEVTSSGSLPRQSVRNPFLPSFSCRCLAICFAEVNKLSETGIGDVSLFSA